MAVDVAMMAYLSTLVNIVRRGDPGGGSRGQRDLTGSSQGLADPATAPDSSGRSGATELKKRHYDTASRVVEITALILQDLYLASPGHVTLTGKRSKTRTVPLTEQSIEHLRVYLDESHPNLAKLPSTGPVFYRLHHGQWTELPVDTFSAVLKQAAATARTSVPRSRGTSTATSCARPGPWTATRYWRSSAPPSSVPRAPATGEPASKLRRARAPRSRQGARRGDRSRSRRRDGAAQVVGR